LESSSRADETRAILAAGSPVFMRSQQTIRDVLPRPAMGIASQDSPGIRNVPPMRIRPSLFAGD
jgi:hypothetical protein